MIKKCIKISIFLVVLSALFIFAPAKKTDAWDPYDFLPVNISILMFEYDEETGQNNLNLDIEPGTPETEVIKEMLIRYEEIYQGRLDEFFGKNDK